jgi:AcrR family transcriptional regulator
MEREAGPVRVSEVRPNDRPRRHEGSSTAETAIFDATEKLLAQHSLQDLSVAQIIAEAGLSRATFYFYFGSKYSVAAALLGRITDEIFEFVEPYVSRASEQDWRGALSGSLRAAIEIWERHRPTLRAAMQHWSTNEEIGGQWIGGIELFTDTIAGQIERERRAGVAPDGPDARGLAAALLWGTQHCLYAAGLGVDGDLDGERGAYEPLMAMWTRSIYGDPGAG